MSRTVPPPRRSGSVAKPAAASAGDAPAAPPARFVVGTAGHIDHGKTALARALTGIDTDRLPEEKRRGITIELGFAHLDAGGRRIGVVDVPGHERFVRTMVAGASGIDAVLLVVAADEGVMPQTREHLDICALLGIPRGLVVLSKSDAVAPDWLALVSEEVRAVLRGTFLADAALIPCSSVTGAGVDAVRAEIARLAAQASARPVDGPLRLPIDRVFTMKGFGTVVTGTLAGGRLREGDEVAALPGGAAGRVRGLQVHGAVRPEALAGERTAVNLLGVERDAVSRGEVLVCPGELAAASIVDVELRLLPVAPAPLAMRAKVLVHALTAQAGATVILLEGDSVEPGASAVAQLHLEAPMALLPGDRFILRGFRPLPGHGTTLGGGRVLRVHGPRRRRADAAASARARALATASTEERIALEIEGAGRDGIDRAGLRARTGASVRRIDKTLDALLSRRDAVTFHRDSGAVVAASALAALTAEAGAAVDAFHAAAPLLPGIDKEELRSRLGAPLDARLFAVVLADLVRRGVLASDGDFVRRAGFSPKRAEAAIDALTAKVHALYRDAGLAPPWSNELPARAGAAPAEAAAALEILVRRGDVVRVKPDLCFDRAAIDALRTRLCAFLADAGQITPQQWKALTGQSRKYAIPLAELFDAEKLTLRVGETRRPRGR